MDASDFQVELDLNAFLNKYGNTHARQEILLFWALHPHARFNRLAVLSAIDCSKLDARKTLDDMVSDKLVEINTDSGIDTYSLTSDGNIRKLITLIRTFDCSQRQILFQQINSSSNAVSNQKVPK